MKKRAQRQKWYRRGWRRTAYHETGRRHRIPYRRYCERCGRSFSIFKAEKQGHMHSPPDEDYYGEYVEEKNECARCLKDLDEWIEKEHCAKCMGLRPRSRHGRKLYPDIACKCAVFKPICDNGHAVQDEFRAPDDFDPEKDEGWAHEGDDDGILQKAVGIYSES